MSNWLFDYLHFSDEITGLADEWLQRGNAGRGACYMIAGVVAHAERVAARAAAGIDVSRIACRAGCPHCCVLSVSALIPEVAAIADYLRFSLDVDGVARLRGRIRDVRRRIRWVDPEERRLMGVACPFLDSTGACMVHPVRPLTCRGITSTDPARCRQALATLDPDEAATVEMNLLHKYLMDEAYRGVARALERRRLDSRGVELVAGVGTFLDNRHLLDQFMAGGKVDFSD